MTWQFELEKWRNNETLEATLRQQITDEHSDDQLEDYFYKNLSFGTAGLRGELGVGTNRMNIYTVRKAVEGLARYIESYGEVAMERGVAIAYDSRHQSAEFGLEAAKVLGSHGIRSYLFDELQPTPLLSYAVRHLHSFSGIVITASHNPAEYNGLKVYGEDGGQITSEAAQAITAYMEEVEDLFAVEVADESTLVNEEILLYLNDIISTSYLNHFNEIQLGSGEANSLSIVYTPLHGAGGKLVVAGLAAAGFNNVTLVAEQAIPDPNFSTVTFPNPEDSKAFALAIHYGKRVNAEILLATDPDADRMGVAVRNGQGEYTFLTGNQIGALLLNALLEEKSTSKTLPANGVMIKSIVTSEFGKAIAHKYEIQTLDVLTGFKYIGEKITEFEQTNAHTFLFGYEESYGYLIGDFVRDKDAVQACVLFAEVAARYKAKGQTVLDGLQELYEEHGFYAESLKSITLPGKTGMEKIEEIVNHFRADSFSEDFTLPLVVVEDYESSLSIEMKTGKQSTIDLPSASALKFKLANDMWFAIRPSGTEPKIKFYFGVKGATERESKHLLKQLEEAVMRVVERVTG